MPKKLSSFLGLIFAQRFLAAFPIFALAAADMTRRCTTLEFFAR
jgi:hypothetical protein